MATSPKSHDTSTQTIADDPETSCAACGHPKTTHDTIAARFCAATIVGQFSRGCVCTGAALT